MYKVDIWVWVDSRSTKVDLKGYAYSIETEKSSGFVRRTGEGEIAGTWNKATLTALAEVLERFQGGAEVVLHCENRWVLQMIDRCLATWESADFYTSKDDKVANEAEWRRIAKMSHILKITTDPVGFDRGPELMNHALADEVPAAM